MRAAPTFPQELPGFAQLADALASFKASQVGFVWDANVHRLWHGHLLPALAEGPLCVLPSGEAFKHLGSVERIWQWLHDHRFDRQSLLVAIGGGVLCDTAALAASTWLRGIRYVLVPTTLLAMVDAAYGGKTGVDFRGGKNLIGTFAQPEAIWVHPPFQQTQTARELRAGRAEMIKHALIGDEAHLEALVGNQPLPWTTIERSLRVKARLVEADPTEQGPRKALNFGHTLGHALESARLTSPESLLHGEAVATGMVLAARLSQQVVGLAKTVADFIEETILQAGFNLALGPATTEELLAHALYDKKNHRSELRFVLLQALGQPVVDVAVSAGTVTDLLTAHRANHG